MLSWFKTPRTFAFSRPLPTCCWPFMRRWRPALSDYDLMTTSINCCRMNNPPSMWFITPFQRVHKPPFDTHLRFLKVILNPHFVCLCRKRTDARPLMISCVIIMELFFVIIEGWHAITSVGHSSFIHRPFERNIFPIQHLHLSQKTGGSGNPVSLEV